MARVRLQNVKKEYRRDTNVVKVLDGITLDIADGDFVALMGPSGSGKTTLLNRSAASTCRPRARSRSGARTSPASRAARSRGGARATSASSSSSTI
jgi:ABC-type lipoprotein export system ATPase subunit